MSRAARSGTLSPKGFQFVCDRPEPVKPNEIVEHRERCFLSPYAAAATRRACARKDRARGLPFRIFDSWSSTMSVPAGPLERLRVMRSFRRSSGLWHGPVSVSCLSLHQRESPCASHRQRIAQHPLDRFSRRGLRDQEAGQRGLRPRVEPLRDPTRHHATTWRAGAHRGAARRAPLSGRLVAGPPRRAWKGRLGYHSTNHKDIPTGFV